MKRTFIAVKIETGEKLKELVSTLASEMKDDSIRWVNTDHMHITLAFLGDTNDETIKKVITVLESSCMGFGEVNFKISGLGVFRNINDPRVIWAGIESNDKFGNLFKVIKEGLGSIEIAIEERQFKPHLTLGRVKRLNNRSTLERMIGQFGKTTFQELSVSEVVFYESILKQSGPLYLPLYIARLK
jgi:RNA 2',3'-cyclic 3'-phosphodiesterase